MAASENETDDEAGATTPRPTRIFTVEDFVLYTCGIIVLLLLSQILFDVAPKPKDRGFDKMFRGDVLASASNAWLDCSAELADVAANVEADYLDFEISNRRLDLKAKQTAAALFVGAAVTLMGCLIIVRGVRGSGATGQFGSEAIKMSFVASSPGAVCVLAGTAIVITTLFANTGGDEAPPFVNETPAPVVTNAPSGSAHSMIPFLPVEK